MTVGKRKYLTYLEDFQERALLNSFFFPMFSRVVSFSPLRPPPCPPPSL